MHVHSHVHRLLPADTTGPPQRTDCGGLLSARDHQEARKSRRTAETFSVSVRNPSWPTGESRTSWVTFPGSASARTATWSGGNSRSEDTDTTRLSVHASASAVRRSLERPRRTSW